MPCKLGYLHEGWVAPDDDLVLRVAVRGDQFIRAPAPGQVADLGARVGALQARTCQHVPEFDGSISRASSGCYQAMLM